MISTLPQVPGAEASVGARERNRVKAASGMFETCGRVCTSEEWVRLMVC